MFVKPLLQSRNSMLGPRTELRNFQFPSDRRLYPEVCLDGTLGYHAAASAEYVLTAQPAPIDHKLITDEAENQRILKD